MSSKDLLMTAKVAKLLNTGPIKLFGWLRENSILMQDNLPYQQYINAGYLKVKETVYTKDGLQRIHIQPLFTAKGVEWLSGHYIKTLALAQINSQPVRA